MRGTDEITTWSVLDETAANYDEEIGLVIETVSRRVHGKYERFCDLNDLTQEARIIAVTKHADCIESADYGYLSFRLERDMMDQCEKAFHVPRNDANGEAKRPDHSAITRQGVITINGEGEKVYSAITSSYDQTMEDEDEERVNLYPEKSVPGGYTEDAIKLLLPAVWDETYAYGLPTREDAPEEGMPRASGNKAHGSSHWAYIADIQTGWKKTDLALDERRALLLRYGMGWDQKDIAFNQGVVQTTISRRIDAAIKKIATRLNGTVEEE